MPGAAAMSGLRFFTIVKQPPSMPQVLDRECALASAHARYVSTFPRRICVRTCHDFEPSHRGGRREGRVSADTHGPRAAKSTRQNHRISQITGLPCADGLRLIRALLGDRRSCPRRSQRSSKASQAWHQHRDARTTRLRRPRRSRPSSETSRPPHPLLNVRDDASAPPIEPGCGEEIIISVKTK